MMVSCMRHCAMLFCVCARARARVCVCAVCCVLVCLCKMTDMFLPQGLMASIVDAIKAANAAKDRASPFVNHMNAIAEGLNAFQWVAVVRYWGGNADCMRS